MFNVLYYIYQFISSIFSIKLGDLERKPSEPVIPKPVGPTPTPPIPAPPTPPKPKYPDEYDQMLRLINSYRSREKLSELRLDDTLCKCAQEHTEWMADKKTLSHTGFEHRVADYGVTAENVAEGDKDPTTIFEMWRKSKGHRRNMLSNATLLGIGYKNGYWTNCFK